jgi:hypothetical protein
MAFTIEDGTLVDGANAFVSATVYRAYCDERGIEVTATDGEIEQASVRTTDYTEARFGRYFIGELVETTQALSWPRSDAGDYLETEIPAPLLRAHCEYIRRELSAPLAPDPTVDASGATTVVTKKKLGPLEQEFQVMNAGVPTLMRSYPMADMMIAPLLVQGQRVIR